MNVLFPFLVYTYFLLFFFCCTLPAVTAPVLAAAAALIYIRNFLIYIPSRVPQYHHRQLQYQHQGTGMPQEEQTQIVAIVKTAAKHGH